MYERIGEKATFVKGEFLYMISFLFSLPMGYTQTHTGSLKVSSEKEQ
jgi:hypothetical protein